MTRPYYYYYYYYYGSDVVFLVCWLPPVVFGDGGLLSLKLRRHDHLWQQARCGLLEERTGGARNSVHQLWHPTGRRREPEQAPWPYWPP